MTVYCGLLQVLQTAIVLCFTLVICVSGVIFKNEANNNKISAVQAQLNFFCVFIVWKVILLYYKTNMSTNFSTVL